MRASAVLSVVGCRFQVLGYRICEGSAQQEAKGTHAQQVTSIQGHARRPSAARRTWHSKDSQGQILASTLMQKSFEDFKVPPLRSAADAKRASCFLPQGCTSAQLSRTGAWNTRSCTKRLSISKFSGNEVYYAILILLVKNMLCSKLHCQKTFISKVFSYNIAHTLSTPYCSHQNGLAESPWHM